MTIRVRPFITGGMLTAALLVAGCGEGSGEGDETPSTEPTTQATEPVLTAPPTRTPEEEAEAAIKETFRSIIAARDEFNANADKYSQDDISGGEPVASWPVTGGGELELFNQASIWIETELNAVGDTLIKSHDPKDVKLNVTGDLDIATSVACIDLTQVTFATYSGEPTGEIPFERDKYQRWNMEWEYLSNVESADDNDAGWHLSALNIEHGLDSC